MNIKDFNDHLENRINKIREVLAKKSSEYADGTADKLYNFKRASKIGNCTNRKALAGMMLKHETSVWDIIENVRPVTEEVLSEKIGDMINYLILLEAMVLEELRGVKPGAGSILPSL